MSNIAATNQTPSASQTPPPATIRPVSRPTQRAAAVTPERALAVKTVNDIKRDLASGFNNPVTTDEARAALNRLVDVSKQSPQAAKLAVQQLSRLGYLDKLAKEVTETGIIPGHGGLPRHELANAYGELARNLDGSSLARIGQSLSKSGAGESVQLLGDQIANHASTAAKLEFINKTAVGNNLTNGEPGPRTIDADALAVASVVGSLRGAFAQEALHSLNDTNLAAVLRAGVGQDITTESGGRGLASVYNPQRFDGILQAAASTGDVVLKARVFGAGVDRLTAIRQSKAGAPDIPSGQIETANKLASSLEKLLSSDSNGIIEQLSRKDREQGSKFGGKQLTDFIKAEYFRGATGYLSKLAVDLSTGNDNNIPPNKFLSKSVQYPDGVRYENATRLGFYVGSLSNAGLTIEKNATKSESGTNDKGKLGLSVVKEIVGATPLGKLGKVIGALISIGKDALPFGVKGSQPRPNTDFGHGTNKRALPTAPSGPASAGRPEVSSAVEAAYNSGVLAGVGR